LEKILAEKTLVIAMFLVQVDRLDKNGKAGERKADEAQEKAVEKAQVKAGKAVSAERKKWQAKDKAIPVETVTIATQTDNIQEPMVIQVDDARLRGYE